METYSLLLGVPFIKRLRCLASAECKSMLTIPFLKRGSPKRTTATTEARLSNPKKRGRAQTMAANVRADAGRRRRQIEQSTAAANGRAGHVGSLDQSARARSTDGLT